MLLPRQAALVPRQPALLPRQAAVITRQSALTPRELVLSPQAGRHTVRARANNPWGSSRLPSQNRGNTLEDPNLKWVINLSNKPLTQAQRSVLVKDPIFAVSPRHPHDLEYITAIESVCTKLGQQDGEEIRADINRVLKSSHLPQT